MKTLLYTLKFLWIRLEDRLKPYPVTNAIKTPDGTVLQSRHRHDFVTHHDIKSGERYILDGGLEYKRTSMNEHPAKDISLDSSAPWKDIRKVVYLPKLSNIFLTQEKLSLLPEKELETRFNIFRKDNSTQPQDRLATIEFYYRKLPKTLKRLNI